MTIPTKTFATTHPAERRGEAGQAIVLIALIMLALIAFLGLAIDGGGLFLLWRQAQNATDSAALAAAYAKCTRSPNWEQAGLDAAAKNGFTNDGTNTVSVNNPPLNGPRKDDPDFVEVVIEAIKPSYFIQVVYKEPLKVSNSAVGLCYPAFDPTTVPGLWAGSSVCQHTVKWGGANSYIEGGLFSNNEIQVQGSNGVIHGPVEAVNGISGNNAIWDAGYPKSGVATRPDPMNLEIRLYAPGGAVYNNVTLHYDVASSTSPDPDWNAGKSTWYPKNRMLAGLYYVAGDVNFQNGLTFDTVKGVTIVATGKIIAGNTKGNYLRFYGEVMNPVGTRKIRYPGILFFSAADTSDKCGENVIKFSGGDDTWGVFYAPKGGMDVSGSKIQMIGSVLANEISYDGSDGRLIYDPSILPPRPPAIQIAE
ncbi:MAG TPA: Tad domain-containing protein [Phototrophicaceae bacterium]|nr:Tad domain-containing protein [Phototrophicaceae bacterium]